MPLLSLSWWWVVAQAIPLLSLRDFITEGRRRKVLRLQFWLTHSICKTVGQLTGMLYRGQTPCGFRFFRIPLSKILFPTELIPPCVLSKVEHWLVSPFFFLSSTDVTENKVGHCAFPQSGNLTLPGNLPT